MGSRHQETDLLAVSNHIIFHFSQKTSRKMEIHQKISLRNLHPLLPEPYLHASTGERTCSKWRGYSLSTHLRSQAVHHEISEAHYNQRLNEKEYSPTVFCKLYHLSRSYTACNKEQSGIPYRFIFSVNKRTRGTSYTTSRKITKRHFCCREVSPY